MQIICERNIYHFAITKESDLSHIYIHDLLDEH